MTRLWLIVLVVWSVIAPCASAQSGQPADPIDLGFESGELGRLPPGWFVPMEGWNAELTDAEAAAGKLSVKLSKPGASNAPFGNLMRTIDAREYQGRRVILTARIRVEGESGRAQMWLRADRPNGQMGAFDNMDDRPIVAGAGAGGWSDATIQADIDPDALQLALGFMSIGGATLYIDSVSLQAAGAVETQEPSAPRPLSPRTLENLQAAARLLSYIRFFHPSDQAAAVQAWDHFAVRVVEEAEPATDAADLAERLRRTFAPIAPTLTLWAGGPGDAPPLPPAPAGATRVLRWRHNGAGSLGEMGMGNVYASELAHQTLTGAPDEAAHAARFAVKPLGGGVACRLPVGVYADADRALPHADAATEWSSYSDKPKLTALNRSTRLAGVALCWGVMQHFYPYFDVVGTDWDAALPAALSKAAQDPDELTYLFTLRELIAKLHDGHGNVYNPSLSAKTMIPVALAWAGEDLVVVGKDASAPETIAIGDALLSINGKPTAQCCEELSQRISAATDGWRRFMLLRPLCVTMPTADPCPVRLRRPDGTEHEAVLARIAPAAIDDATSKKPANGAEVAPGVVYFDLNGAETAALHEALPAMERAKAIVFDLRGYPGSAAYELMQHLIDDEAASARWNIPIVTRPDREAWEWNTTGRWQLKPTAPRLTAHAAFLTDGRAISYAESIMGIVEAYKMGEIVGATTAGTNGNVNPFKLPGGYTVTWTGMQVLKHDGSRHHGVGISPSVPVTPTAKGIADGRDEVLDKAVEILTAKISPEK